MYKMRPGGVTSLASSHRYLWAGAVSELLVIDLDLFELGKGIDGSKRVPMPGVLLREPLNSISATCQSPQGESTVWSLAALSDAEVAVGLDCSLDQTLAPALDEAMHSVRLLMPM